jgi:hypothetical protein
MGRWCVSAHTNGVQCCCCTCVACRPATAAAHAPRWHTLGTSQPWGVHSATGVGVLVYAWRALQEGEHSRRRGEAECWATTHRQHTRRVPGQSDPAHFLLQVAVHFVPTAAGRRQSLNMPFSTTGLAAQGAGESASTTTCEQQGRVATGGGARSCALAGRAVAAQSEEFKLMAAACLPGAAASLASWPPPLPSWCCTWAGWRGA